MAHENILNYNSNSNLYINDSSGIININSNFELGNSYSPASIIELHKREDNLIIISKLNKAIFWSDLNNKWILIDILKLDLQKHDLKDEFKDKFKDKSNFYLNFNQMIFNPEIVEILNLFLLMEGNIFVDLKNKNCFELISKDLGWKKFNLKSFSFNFSNDFNVKDIIKKKENKKLLTEKIKKVNFNWTNYDFTFNNNIVTRYVGGIDVATVLGKNDYFTLSNITLSNLY